MSPPVPAVVVHRFSASAERIFDAWLDVTLISRWMFGRAVRDEHIVRIGLEPRVGGKFSFVVNRRGTEVEHVGEYLEVDRARLLVFTWATRDRLADKSRVIVEITPLDQGCEVQLTHVMAPGWESAAEYAAASWTKMITVLDQLLAPPVRRKVSPTITNSVSLKS